MAKYLLDTGILLGYVKGANYAEYVERTFGVMKVENISCISVVTAGEIYSLAEQLHWGDKKKKATEMLLDELHTIDINDQKIIERYAVIDAFSQGKLVSRKLPEGMSSRNMGKNDLWIAACASVLNAVLLTTDKDFDHLGKEFLEVVYINPKQTIEFEE